MKFSYRFQPESSEAFLINVLTNKKVFKVTGVKGWLLELEPIEGNKNPKIFIPKAHTIDFNEERLQELHPEYYI